MLLSIMLAITIGILAGTITGLIPGIHINLISSFLISSAGVLLGFASPLILAVFIIAMSITHTFLDPIPSVFLGAPDSATALGVLPGHRYLLQGKGYTAVKLTIIGSLGGLVLAVILAPVFMWIVSWFYPLLQKGIVYLLMSIVIFMILRESKKLWALLIFFMSGLLGLLVFALPNQSNVLFPLLSGLFGTSTLLYSLKEQSCIPKQRNHQHIHLDAKVVASAIGSGTFSGWITSVLPGVGSATAAILSLQITRKLGDYGFMILLGAISTVNFALSLVTFLVLEKARNGSVIAVQTLLGNIDFTTMLFFFCIALITSTLATHVGLSMSKRAGSIFSTLPYRKTIVGVIIFLCIMTLALTGILGCVILLSATAIGLIPAIVKTSRTHGMACLLLPVIIYFL